MYFKYDLNSIYFFQQEIQPKSKKIKTFKSYLKHLGIKLKCVKEMENVKQVSATVISPAKSAHIRKGSGFSLLEIKEAGKTIEQIKELKLKIDFNRKSLHKENVDKLKELKTIKKKVKKKEPFIKKEKKRTPFKPKKVKAKPKKVAPKVKEPPKKKKVTKKEPKPIKETKEQVTGTPLTSLSGLGPTTAQKFIELGVNNVEELLKEDPSELSTLIKGVSEDRIQKWIEEATSLLKK